MELFREDGCLTDEGLQALVEGRLDELGRLEAAEHLSYCTKCLDRYTALLTGDKLVEPPRDLSRPLGRAVWVHLMTSVYGRVAVASVAAVLALSIWRSGNLTLILDRNASALETYVPEQIAPPASATVPQSDYETPPRPGQKAGVVQKAQQAVSGFLNGFAAQGGADTD